MTKKNFPAMPGSKRDDFLLVARSLTPLQKRFPNASMPIMVSRCRDNIWQY
jgi:hypothetical protein